MVVEQGVEETRFDLPVGDHEVPGLLWRPAGADGELPTVLIGHGGTSHKRAPYVLALARRLVRHLGISAVAIDAPGHGDRITDPAAADAARANLEARMRAGRGGEPAPIDPELAAQWVTRATIGGSDWKATLDHLQAKGLTNDQVGYWGVSMGTIIGLPYVASEPRVRAAVLGLCGTGDRPGLHGLAGAARTMTIPVLILLQWHDELVAREAGLALWDAIGSQDKALHINPGRHVEIPLRESLAAEAFFRLHLLGTGRH